MRRTAHVASTALPLHFERGDSGDLGHLRLFLGFLQLAVTRATVLHPNLLGYWGR
jgi:hypothetical protein